MGGNFVAMKVIINLLDVKPNKGNLTRYNYALWSNQETQVSHIKLQEKQRKCVTKDTFWFTTAIINNLLIDLLL